MWTPIVKGLATLNDLRIIYSLDDVIEMHEVIAEQLLAEKRSNEA